ncbi:TetR/AcrR family transcriptional regulator [Paraburkholderia xenovorans]|uniref:TetR/AcrR family transcriptional regulator n=1 Tax=Paraburkholderia xenovorans TaxID=36873 RepID=UPI0038BC3435
MNVSSVSCRVPVQARSEQRLKAILEAAWLVFSEVGFASATLTEIAGDVGVSQATISTYLASKRDLCVRVLGNSYDEIISQGSIARSRLARPTTPGNRIRSSALRRATRGHDRGRS